MQLNKSNPVKSGLVITLSNIGDCILTLPVIDALRDNFSGIKLTVLAGPKAECIFKDNPFIANFISYNKHSRWEEKFGLIRQLKKEDFDLVLDLRNTAFGIFLNAAYKTSPFLNIPKEILHMRARHLYKLETTAGIRAAAKIGEGVSFYISPEDYKYIEAVFAEHNISPQDKIVVISPGAATHLKQWTPLGFSVLCDELMKETNIKVIIVGDKNDAVIAREVAAKSSTKPINLCQKTTISQLGALLKRSDLLVSNDSAVMHLASYLDRNIVAIFGPTDETRYGPWSKKNIIIRNNNLKCAPCRKAECSFNLECMKLIGPEKVIQAARRLLNNV